MTVLRQDLNGPRVRVFHQGPSIAAWILLLVSLVLSTKIVAKDSEHEGYESVSYPLQVLWGDTHLHTTNSLDARVLGVTLDTEHAYRFARGDRVVTTTGITAQLARPLDFLVVSDHAEMLGVMRAVREETFIKDDLGFFGNLKRWYAFRLMNNAIDENRGREFFSEFLQLKLKA